MGASGACNAKMSKTACAMAISSEIVSKSRKCFAESEQEKTAFQLCAQDFCGKQCGKKNNGCKNLCINHANPLFDRLAAMAPAKEQKLTDADPTHMNKAQLMQRSQMLQQEQGDAMAELQHAQQKMVDLNNRIKARAEQEIKNHDPKGERDMAKVQMLGNIQDTISGHLANVQAFTTVALREQHQSGMGFVQKQVAPKKATTLSFLQQQAPEDELAKEMTHDLEMNFNKIAPFGKEDTAKELQDHAAKTQDTLVDAVENAEVAEIKRAVFRALTRLRAATIKEFDTIARLETQAIDAYNDAHHYRAENPLAHLHEDEAPVETDKLKSFH